MIGKAKDIKTDTKGKQLTWIT